MGPYRLFDLVLVRRTRLCPSLTRFTFGGLEVDRVAAFAPDQRIKLFFPGADGQAPRLSERLSGSGPDWYDAYRGLAEAERPPMRSYTIRALRPAAGEIDIDFVMHGPTGYAAVEDATLLGPAGRWAARARLGDRLSMSAPDRAAGGPAVGFEWRPPRAVRQVLIAADETALPAAMGIVETLKAWDERPRVRLLAETPGETDRLPVPAWVEAQWLPRTGGYGQALTAAVKGLDLSAVLPSSLTSEADEAVSRLDIDAEILWDTEVDETSEFYAWIACETRAARDIRLHLTRERGLSRRSVACMGYWREGRVLE